MSGLFSGMVWRASNSISFLTLHFYLFLNANSYNAGREERENEVLRKKMALLSIIPKTPKQSITRVIK